MPSTIAPVTGTVIRKIKPGKLRDGGDLYLLRLDGAKWWRRD